MNEEGKRRNYDYTSTQRAARRAAHLHQVAQANGFDTWYKLETAVINGAVLTVGQAGGMVDADGNVGESYQQSTERAIRAAIEMAQRGVVSVAEFRKEHLGE